MRAPITDKHLLEMMWERFPEIMQRGAEQPAQQKPVAVVKGWNCGRLEVIVRSRNQTFEIDQPLYTSPPAQRQARSADTWVGLTDEERCDLLGNYITAEGRARAIEAKLKEKNT